MKINKCTQDTVDFLFILVYLKNDKLIVDGLR